MTKIHRIITAIMCSMASIVTVFCLTSSVTYAGSDKNKGADYQVPRNSQGHPNLQGIWDFRTLTPLERPLEAGGKAVFSAEEAETFRQQKVAGHDVDKQRDIPASFDVEAAYNTFWWDFGTEMNEDRRTSLIVDPANGRLPALTPKAREDMKRNLLHIPPVRVFGSLGEVTFRPKGPEALGLSERCLVGFNAGPPLIPSAYNNNIRIVQAPGYIVLFTEMIHDARIIAMDNSPQLPQGFKKWSGGSKGHWDKDTLVIETSNFTDKTPVYQLPINLKDPAMNGVVGRGKDFKLTERLTRISDSRLLYEYTIDEPNTFTKPFTVAIPMKASKDQIFEYACHEGNHSMTGMLGGARTLEREAAQAAKK
ncbi:MAG: hypothetical protein DRQ64_00920 [Gammaproteobacteria bacterium]|nr:MAG: hypothetical protein DRQ64_00920 [Gammaproteobacteria bacterium]